MGKESAAYVKKLRRGRRCPGCGRNASETGRPLQFHHRDPSTKEFEVSRAPSKSLDLVKAEIDKCVLICFQCHRRLHMRDGFEIAVIRNVGGEAHLDIIGCPE